MSCNRISKDCPITTNEENSGFIQTQNGTKYSASLSIDDSRKNNSYFILYNPLHSMKDIYISRTLHANTGDSPVLVRSYCNCCDLLPKNAERSRRITNNNTHYCDVPSTAQVYTGTNIQCINNIPFLEYTVKSYENFNNDIDGNIILSPGSYYLEVTKGSSCECNSCQVSNISWWEHPIF